MTGFIAPVEKFRDYVFKPGAIHGKDHVFRSLGYDRSHSEMLSALYSSQAAAKYAAQEYLLGKADKYRQRIGIEIEPAVTTLTSEGIYFSRDKLSEVRLDVAEQQRLSSHNAV